MAGREGASPRHDEQRGPPRSTRPRQSRQKCSSHPQWAASVCMCPWWWSWSPKRVGRDRSINQQRPLIGQDRPERHAPPSKAFVAFTGWEAFHPNEACPSPKRLHAPARAGTGLAGCSLDALTAHITCNESSKGEDANKEKGKNTKQTNKQTNENTKKEKTNTWFRGGPVAGATDRFYQKETQKRNIDFSR